MVGLDTNVLVRLLTADEPVQLAAATRLLQAHDGEPAAFFVNDIVLVELTWVLRRLYEFDNKAAVEAIKSLLDNDAFCFQDRDRLDRVVSVCRTKGFDFADAMIALTNEASGCESTASFDRGMRHLPKIQLL